MMYGQMTAGSWIYIGTQGILQGTYETFAAVARKRFGGTLRGAARGDRRARRDGRRAAARGHDVRRHRAVHRGRPAAHRAADRRPATSTSARPTSTTRWRGSTRRRARERAAVDRPARQRRRGAARARAPRRARRRRDRPDLRARPAERLRPRRTDRRAGRRAAARATPTTTCARVGRERARPRRRDPRARARRRGGVRLRQRAARRGRRARRRGRVRLPRLRARLHPAAVLRGQGAVPLGGALRRPGGHRTAPTTRSSTCSATRSTSRAGSGWRRSACSSRGCRRGSAGSATASATWPGCASTRWSPRASCTAPIVIGRDHLDAGSVASPQRETEAMRDGSDAVADWPILNALVNTACGRELGVGAPRRRRRHGQVDPRRPGRRRRRHRGSAASGSSAC